ncbi:unnamed protein product [Adineta steineri]|uniref:Methyltransferase type 12 domain-containing protein n=1 Tax=Adineta steineri TaxID=433720 RepID=A0A818W7F9_9BILA|nr:unnamed protein product [Adineta steineri]
MGGQQAKKLNYDTTLEFFDEIDPNTSKYHKASQNHWVFMLKKKDPKKPFWKRLIKSTEKCQWIAVDWDHFAAEDDDEEGDLGGKDWGNLDGMLKQMGGDLGGSSATDLNDLEDDEVDSDDEPMPDLEDVPKTNDEKNKSTNNMIDNNNISNSIHGSRSNTERVITEDEYECLYAPEKQDRQQVPVFKQNLYDKNAQKHWDQFYKRNTNNFFKDRHWTLREFNIDLNEKMKLFEIGCGVGNFLFPLLNELPNLSIYACDFSSTAIELLRQNSNYDQQRIQSFVYDLTDETEIPIEENSIDICSMIFVLSAIHPDKMSCVLKKISKVLKPGGYLLFRDYGLYDHAMFRFARQRQHKLSENFYVRQDGTRAYFFSIEYLTNLLNESQFNTDELSYVFKETVNVKEEICVPRVFIQGKFQKK